MDKELTNYDKRDELEKLGKNWFSCLRELECLTDRIIKDETLEELELIDMRDNVRKVYFLLQYSVEDKAIKKWRNKNESVFQRL